MSTDIILSPESFPPRLKITNFSSQLSRALQQFIRTALAASASFQYRAICSSDCWKMYTARPSRAAGSWGTDRCGYHRQLPLVHDEISYYIADS